MLSENVKLKYEKEIGFQKHMIDNLRRWQSLFFLLTGVFIVLLYFFHTNIVVMITLVVLLLLSILGAWIFGQGIFNGRKNVNKIIDEYEKLLHGN